MRSTVAVVIGMMAVAILARVAVHQPVVVFVSSAVALMILSKILGDATEHCAVFLGQRSAGLLNVTLSNLPEAIILFVAVQQGLVELVQAGIVGSIMGNILLVMGLSAYLGCKKNGTMFFRQDVADLFINQLATVAVILFVPTLFNSHIPTERQGTLSYLLAGLLVAVYVYFLFLSRRDPRFHETITPSRHIGRDWTRRQSILVLVTSGLAAFAMSELLMTEIEPVAQSFHLSNKFMGFIFLPLLGNLAERSAAIRAARKNMAELSLAISIGSAAQVGMIIAPLVVLFGVVLGHPVLLYFPHLPLAALFVSIACGYSVLQNNKWNVNEGMFLLAIYLAFSIAFAFTS